MERCVTTGRFNARVIGVDGEGLLIEICERGREVVCAEGEGEPRSKASWVSSGSVARVWKTVWLRDGSAMRLVAGKFAGV